jgi:hypothetical protein
MKRIFIPFIYMAIFIILLLVISAFTSCSFIYYQPLVSQPSDPASKLRAQYKVMNEHAIHYYDSIAIVQSKWTNVSEYKNSPVANSVVGTPGDPLKEVRSVRTDAPTQTYNIKFR